MTGVLGRNVSLLLECGNQCSHVIAPSFLTHDDGEPAGSGRRLWLSRFLTNRELGQGVTNFRRGHLAKLPVNREIELISIGHGFESSVVSQVDLLVLQQLFR